MDKPFIHFITIGDNRYLFDVNTNMIIKITLEIYEYLNNHGSDVTYVNELSSEGKKILLDLKEQGLLKDSKPKIIYHPMTDLVEDMLKSNLSRMILQVTQNCNLRCQYCVYSGSYNNRVHNNKRMDIETAKKAIDFLKNHSQSAEDIIISFYGGEPLLEMKLIQECVTYSKKVFEGKKVSFNLTTNAVLLSEENIEYLSKEDFILTISLDGPKEVHDKNRKFVNSDSGTYDIVMRNLEKILDIAPDYIAKVTFNAVLDDESSFEDTNDFFMKHDIVKNMIVSANSINAVNRKEQLKAFSVKNYVDRNYESFIGMLYSLGRVDKDCVSHLIKKEISDIKEKISDRSIVDSTIPMKSHPGGPCVPGFQRPFVNAYGKLFPCERVSETAEYMCIGNLDDGFDMNRIKEMLNIGRLTEDNCRNCWAYNFCTQCVATADDGICLSKENRLEKCNAVRNYVENMIKDYIVLKENGCQFTNLV